MQKTFFKIFTVIIAAAICSSIVIATNSSESNNYASSVSLSASVSDNDVQLSWSIAGGEAPLGFKIVKSLNSNPTYPCREGDYYRYLSDLAVRSYTWEDLAPGTWHIRVGVYQGGSVATYSNDVAVTIPSNGYPTATPTSVVGKTIIPGFHAPSDYEAAWLYQTQPDAYDPQHPSFENQSFNTNPGDTIVVHIGIRNTGNNSLKAGELVIATYKDTKVRSAPAATGYDNPFHADFGKSYFYDQATWLSVYQAATLENDLSPGASGELTINLKIPTDAPCGYYREDFSTAIDNAAVNKKWLLNTTNGDSFHVLHIWIGINVLCGEDVTPEPLATNTPPIGETDGFIIDHRHTQIEHIPSYWIERAKQTIRITYGHTSHGSQIVSGMQNLMSLNSLYSYNYDGTGGALSLHDYQPSGDLGNPDRTSWAQRTRELLNGSGSDRTVVMWSWCGQVSTASEADINTYLNLMQELENEYPAVTFVYMTGHLDGSGTSGNLYQRNEQIRNYARAHNKVLFDFADIESYDPDSNFYPNESDSCSWCSSWCSVNDCGTLPSSCAHSHAFNCNQKGHAFWWMMARLAGWEG